METRNYNAIAHRFLITSLAHPELEIYDPATDEGPWRYEASTQTHYWDGKVTVEFMLEEDIPVSDFNQIGPCQHHEFQCCVDTVNCDQKNTDSQDASAQFIAKVIACDVPLHARHFTHLMSEGRYPNSILIYAMGKFKEVINGEQPATFAWLSESNPLAEFYIKAALHLLKPYKPMGFNSFAQAFLSQKDCANSLALLMAKKFELTTAASLGYK